MAERELDIKSLDWPGLDDDGLVVEVGGFKGRWASAMAGRYQCRVEVFEPQIWAATRAGEALAEASNAKWGVHHYGLSTLDDEGDQVMGAWGTDGCSLLKDEVYMETYVGSRDKSNVARFRDALPVLNELGEIDVMMMNIEGYEYQLLPYIIGGGALDHIRYLAVQFHTAFEQAMTGRWANEYEWLYELIGQTHREMGWGFGRPLMTWERR